MPTEMTVMTARAPKVPANTVALSCWVARMTAMKNVLSPISLKKMSRNAWRKPSSRPPVPSTASVASAMAATDAANASGATARPARASTPAAVATERDAPSDRGAARDGAASPSASAPASAPAADAIHSRGVVPTTSGKRTLRAATAPDPRATSRGSNEARGKSARTRPVAVATRRFAATEVGLPPMEAFIVATDADAAAMDIMGITSRKL
mmetsp:Transcript_13850/g.54914  ORF Transcript_13850/g.54914 Transcript_13850/m.54914 type:complete len:211 (+) Transcript_13850:619-1251(+)